MKKVVLSTLTAFTLSSVALYATPNPTLEHKSIAKVTGVEHSILEKIHFAGDLRLRYESKETRYKDNNESTNKYTYHNRYRLRLEAIVDLTRNLKFDVGMRSGYGNPTSGNQTFLDDKALSDYFWQSLRFNILNLSYKDKNTKIKIGRHPYMIYRPIKSQLIWDNDLSFNGISYRYENNSFIVNIGANQPTYAERVTAKDTINLYFAQYVQKIKLQDAKLNLGTAFYYYDGVKGNTPIYATNKGTGMGNTLVNGVFKNDYHILEAFGEYKVKNLLGKPFAIAIDLAYNSATSDKNFGYDIGFQIGKAKKVHDWQLKYSYTDTQADAVLGAHSDSDNFGGGTAAKGHAIRAKYKFGKKTYLAATLFFNTLDEGKKENKPEADYERVQLDTIIKF